MRISKPNKWMPLVIMAMIFSLLLAFNNCSESDSGSESSEMTGAPVEVIDTSGMDGEVLSEKNLPDLEQELESRRDRKETELAFTTAAGCGPNKVIVCHFPEGAPQKDLCMDVADLQQHVEDYNGDEELDHVGSCFDAFKLGDI